MTDREQFIGIPPEWDIHDEAVEMVIEKHTIPRLMKYLSDAGLINTSTLRDQFAMAALTGLIANRSTDTDQNWYATRSYEFADAMIKQLEETPPK